MPTDEPLPRPRRARFLTPRRRKYALRLATILLLVFSAMRLLAPVNLRLETSEVAIRMVPVLPGGHVRLLLGPFGELSWSLHRGPLDIEASFLIGRNVKALPRIDEVRGLPVAFLVRKTPWLVTTGALIGMLLVIERSRRRRLLAAGIGAGSAVGIFAILLGVSAATFNAAAFNDPRYRGPIEDAPRVIQLLREVQRDWAGVQRNIDDMVGGLQRIHAQIVTAERSGFDEETIKFLVVSDIHNNPLALEIAASISDRFGIDAVLDAGDFTDRGTQIEGELFARTARVQVPYIAVAGNHEDTAALARIRQLPNLQLLESRSTDVATVQGITILGESDPNAYFVDSNPRNAVALAEIPRLCEQLRDRFLALRPEIVLVHNPDLGACAADAAKEEDIPLVYVWGHMHRPSYAEDGLFYSVSPGTSGANGIKTERPAPYGLTLLEFEPVTRQLVSTCLFQFDTPTELRQASCHTNTPEEQAEAEGATGSPIPTPSPTRTPTPTPSGG